MGAILEQEGRTVSTFSHKLKNAQKKYTVMGQKLLAAIKACKHFGQIIWGCDIWIHTDHQNLTHDDMCHANLWEQQARIFLDAKFAPTFIHIAGSDNTAMDGLSQLPMANDNIADNLGEIFLTINNLDRGTNNDFPLNMHQIMLAQVKDSD